MEKICSKCKLPKDESCFDKKRGGLAPHCKVCRKAYVKDHYDRNVQYYVDKSTKTFRVNRLWLDEYKSQLSCVDCGFSFEKEPFLCDFHHTQEKEAEVGKLLRYSQKRIIKEISKCIPLCALCHRRRHHKKV